MGCDRGLIMTGLRGSSIGMEIIGRSDLPVSRANRAQPGTVPVNKMKFISPNW